MTPEELAAQEAAAKKAAEDEAAAKTAAEKTAAEKAASEGKKTPTDEEARLLKEVMEKKEKLQKVSTELDAMKALKAQLDGLGGLEALEKLVTERKTAEMKELEDKRQWETLRERMAAENAKVVGAANEKASKFEKELQEARAEIDNLTIGSAFASSKFISEDMTNPPSKMRALFGQHFDRVDGQVVGFDKPRGAPDRAPIVTADGKPMPFDEALKRIVEADTDKDSLYKSKLRPGAGSDSRRTQAARTEAPRTGIERIAAGLASLTATK